MNKGQGFFAGTFLAAALLLRVGGGLPTESKVSSKPLQDTSSVTSNTQTKPGSAAEGPWIASCRYWAPSKNRTNDETANTAPGSADVQIAIQGDKGEVEVNATQGGGEVESGCASDSIGHWGIPRPSGRESPKIKTVIAIVPDPVHTHLAMGFDRTVQVLLQAAADNGYLSSYYWLPWRAEPDPVRSSLGPSAEDSRRISKREREPGLIVLKRNPILDADVPPSKSFYDVMYVFLVAETPTEGVDGFQLQNAFFYKSQIEGIVGHNGDPSHSVSSSTTIIGPTYSGSAASLRVAIEKTSPTEVWVFGITQTLLSVQELNSPGRSNSSRVNYYSFGADIAYNMDEFLTLTMASGYDPAQIAVLSEDDTVYGSEGLGSKGREDINSAILYMHFPREISALRTRLPTLTQRPWLREASRVPTFIFR